MTQYQNGYCGKREFIHERFIIADYTKSKTRYYDLIRLLCSLFNCRCLRDEQGEYKDYLYFIGRSNSVKNLIYFIRLLVVDIESEVDDHREYQEPIPINWSKHPADILKHGSAKKLHKSSYIAAKRVEIINSNLKELRTILKLKKEFYYDKYATLRKVRENEVMDNTLFPEYIKQYRLTHLKPFKNEPSSTRSSEGKAPKPNA